MSMTQPRRVSFTTLGDLPRSNHLKTFRRVDEEQPQMTKPPSNTIRITLNLFEPNDDHYPEFFYHDVVKRCQENGEGASSGAKKRDPAHPFAGDKKERQELEAQARKFEEKYGGKRPRKDRIEDLMDLGYGYDESDSFIDNSEAYDELVPSNITTKYGGFYINSGKLEFRQLSESEEECVETKKRKLEDGGVKLERKKKKVVKRKKKNVYCKDKEKKASKSKLAKSGIELQTRELNSQMRSGVYAHLAAFFPCSKDTLVKRARKLYLYEQGLLHHKGDQTKLSWRFGQGSINGVRLDTWHGTLTFFKKGTCRSVVV